MAGSFDQTGRGKEASPEAVQIGPKRSEKIGKTVGFLCYALGSAGKLPATRAFTYARGSVDQLRLCLVRARIDVTNEVLKARDVAQGVEVGILLYPD